MGSSVLCCKLHALSYISPHIRAINRTCLHLRNRRSRFLLAPRVPSFLSTVAKSELDIGRRDSGGNRHAVRIARKLHESNLTFDRYTYKGNFTHRPFHVARATLRGVYLTRLARRAYLAVCCIDFSFAGASANTLESGWSRTYATLMARAICSEMCRNFLSKIARLLPPSRHLRRDNGPRM